VPIVGATNDQIVLGHAQFSDAGTHSVVVSNAEGSVTSVNAALTVNPPKGGDVDYSFAAASINERVGSIAVQPDGKILITEVRGGRVQVRSPILSITEKLISGKHRRFR